MKIMCVIGAYSFGGAERVMTTLANRFSQDNKVVFVAMQHRDAPAYEIASSVKTINGLNYKNELQAILKLRKIIRREKPDVIIAFLTQINITTILASRFLGIPVIISERNDPTKRITNVRKKLRAWLYPKASGVVFQTEDAQAYYSKKIQRKSTIIPNPVFIDEANVAYISAKRRKEIVAAGRLSYQKNYPMLIEAFAGLADDLPDYKLLIYGEGEDREKLEKLIADKDLSERITLMGAVSDLHERIKDSSLYVMTSRFEGMPNALMEAMALGLFCISTDCPVGGPRSLIRDGENGFLVGVSDTAELERKMRLALSDKEQAEYVASQAKYILNVYNVDAICARWEKYINQVIK